MIDAWDQAAPGWGRRRSHWERFLAPLSHAMVAELAPQPGQHLLELAAGVGETGFLAAELIAPGGGRLLCTDASEGMLEQARERARELGLEAVVEFKQMQGEWIDAPLASLDGVLCRLGLMLMEDPSAALRECRRSLRSGGRIAIAVWGESELNPLLSAPAEALRDLAGSERPAPGAPGPFRLADPAELADLIAGAGFGDVAVEPLALELAAASFEEFWELHLDLSLATRAALEGMDDARVQAFRAALAQRLNAEAGPLRVPASVLLASAEA